MNDEYVFKILFLGSSCTGAKTSLIVRLITNAYIQNYITTIGIDIKNCIVITKYGIAKLILYDAAGQERFRSLTKNYIRYCQCFILGYDITDKYSFEDIKKSFYNLILDNLDGSPVKNPLIYLAANKIDHQDEI